MSESPADVIQSIVSIGTYEVLDMNQTNPAFGPFCSRNNFQYKNLSESQVHGLYHAFSRDRGRTIDDTVINEIFLLCNGHAGLINICGMALESSLENLPVGQHIDMDHWKSVVGSLLSCIIQHGSFQKIIRNLAAVDDPLAQDSLRLYRLCFLGEGVEMTRSTYSLVDGRLLRYLAALGVLLSTEETYTFTIASPLMDSLIRLTVIPDAYPNAPKTTLPKRSDLSLDVLAVIKTSLLYFDKDYIEEASSKSAQVRVNNSRQVTVPPESVYDSEMIRVVKNWTMHAGLYAIVGQIHVDRNFYDIVIQDMENPRQSVVLEFVATETPEKIREHITRTIDYKRRISAMEGWIVHFTRQDDYLGKPYWPKDENVGVNIVHIWHNREFTDVRLSAQWEGPGGVKMSVENERVI